MTKLKLGLFDSGIGGFSLLHPLFHHLKECDFFYFADTAYSPWGDLDTALLKSRIQTIIHYFESHNVDTIIIACNTSSILFYEEIKARTKIKVIQLVDLLCESAITQSLNKNITVLATNNTVNVKGFSKTLSKMNTESIVTEIACPSFVPAIENENSSESELSQLVEQQLHKIKNTVSDTLIYGCTHYPFLDHYIRKYIRPDIVIISSQTIVSALIKRLEIGLYQISKITNKTSITNTLNLYDSGNSQSLKAWCLKLGLLTTHTTLTQRKK